MAGLSLRTQRDPANKVCFWMSGGNGMLMMVGPELTEIPVGNGEELDLTGEQQ